MNHQSHLAFEIAATPTAVDALCARAEAWLAESGLGKESFPLTMLLREGLNNSMLHGCDSNPNAQIRCHLQRGRKWLKITIEDDGPGFDWAARQECRAGIEDCHGRGLEIYRLYAEEVYFNRRGNRVRLQRQIAKD
jgi:serine/threonine-protein kinase RsbW